MMMKRVFTLLALAVCVSSEASAFVHRGGAQKAVGKAAAKAKVVTPKKCVLVWRCLSFWGSTYVVSFCLSKQRVLTI